MIARMAEIRPARADDVDDVLDVGRETWRATYIPLAGEAFVREGLARWWTAEGTLPSIEDGRVWVAEVDGRIVGMLAYMDGNAAARAFYEHAGFRETHREADELGGPDNIWLSLPSPGRNPTAGP